MALTFSTDLAPGLTLIPVVLVDGVPVILTPAGVHPTTVTGAVPASWWPGAGTLTETLPSAATFDPVMDWLDTSAQWVVSERVSLVEGDLDVPALQVQLYDPAGAATAALSGPGARVGTLLAAEASAAAVSLTVASTTPAAGQEQAHLGREAVTFTGTATGPPRLTGVTRGLYGSTARFHPAPAERLPVVTFGRWPRYWHGRGCKVFLAILSGTTLSSITLWYQGILGAGVELVDGLTRWHLPVDHITSALRREYTPPTLDLYGVAHYASLLGQSDATRTPYKVAWITTGYALTDDVASPHGGGWHPSWENFLGALRVHIYTASAAPPEVLQLVQQPGAMLAAVGIGGTETAAMIVSAAWHTPARTGGTGSQVNVTVGPLPEACFWLDGWLKIPSAVDLAKIPTTLSYTVATPASTARLAIAASTDALEEYVAVIEERDAARSRVRLTGLLDWLRPAGPTIALCTKRTTAELVISATGNRWDGALRAAGLAIDALQGADGTLDAAIDWAAIGLVLDRYPSILPAARQYRIKGKDTLLSMIVRECRLGGFVPVMRGAKVSIARIDDVALTEGTETSITSDDLDTAEEVEVIDASDGITSTVSFKLGEDGDEIRWTDTTLVDEFGAGATVEVTLDPSVFPAPLVPADLARTLRDLAWSILGTTAHPYRCVKLPCGPHKGDVEAGDVVSLTHHAIPTFDGVRGISGVSVRVQEVERRFFGGRATHAITVRLPVGTPKGYAPEALVEPGGIAVDTPIGGQSTVSLDVASTFGAQGFAPSGSDGGATWFEVGDKVVLAELDAAVPVAEEAFTVVSVTGADVVLNGNPTAPMIALAAAQYKALLKYDDYATATRTSPVPGQHDFAFLSDGTDLGASDAPHRYSA